jgi:hypothetical protein
MVLRENFFAVLFMLLSVSSAQAEHPRTVNELFPILAPRTCSDFLLGAGRSLDLTAEINELARIRSTERESGEQNPDKAAKERGLIERMIWYAQLEGLDLIAVDEEDYEILVVPDPDGHPLQQAAAFLQTDNYKIGIIFSALYSGEAGEVDYDLNLVLLSPRVFVANGELWEVVRHELQHYIDVLLDMNGNAPETYGNFSSDEGALVSSSSHYKSFLSVDELRAYLVSLRSLIDQWQTMNDLLIGLPSEFERDPVRRILRGLELNFKETLRTFKVLSQVIAEEAGLVEDALRTIGSTGSAGLTANRSLEGFKVAAGDQHILFKPGEKDGFYRIEIAYEGDKIYQSRQIRLNENPERIFFNGRRVLSARLLTQIAVREARRALEPTFELVHDVEEGVVEMDRQHSLGENHMMEPLFKETIDHLLLLLDVNY